MAWATFRLQGLIWPLQTSSLQKCSSHIAVDAAGSRPRSPRASCARKSSLPTKRCRVCSTAASSKHFGVVSCEGCKSFFRRTVREGRSFECRAVNRCSTRMTKDGGRICRACRWRKCLAVGMDEKAVQRERDGLLPRRGKTSRDQNVRMQPSHGIVDFSKMFLQGANSLTGRSPVALKDLADHLNNSALGVCSWANNVPGFAHFSPPDQSALVQNHLIPHLLLGIAVQSLGNPSLLLIGEKFFIDMNGSEPMLNLGELIVRDIAKPLRDIKLDEVETTMMTSVLLFDITLPGVTDNMMLEGKQTELFVALEHHVSSKICKAGDRFERIWSLIDAVRTTAFEASQILRRAGPQEEASCEELV